MSTMTPPVSERSTVDRVCGSVRTMPSPPRNSIGDAVHQEPHLVDVVELRGGEDDLGDAGGHRQRPAAALEVRVEVDGRDAVGERHVEELRCRVGTSDRSPARARRRRSREELGEASLEHCGPGDVTVHDREVFVAQQVELHVDDGGCRRSWWWWSWSVVVGGGRGRGFGHGRAVVGDGSVGSAADGGSRRRGRRPESVRRRPSTTCGRRSSRRRFQPRAARRWRRLAGCA